MALRGYTIIPELVIDEEGNEIEIEWDDFEKVKFFEK